ncbi:unnamed protein product [Prorocentrum cordatum]|uniref:Beta-lactamase-related domain-containing protein n=1 Tax=Prorocentrum cordatum TaxID=2364126 RepID=A0ABN9X5L0_9DINO|nr:unnamed protein product [Polarella glacialis]
MSVQTSLRCYQNVDAGEYPGFIFCVAKAGKLLHAEAYGHADTRATVPMRWDTLFRLYSQTKPVTVIAFMRLWEEGLVGLNDKVSKYIPAFKRLVVGQKARKPVSRAMTGCATSSRTPAAWASAPALGSTWTARIRRRSPNIDLCARVDRGEISSLEQWCSELAKVPLDFEPGAWWGYGYSSDILGRVAEVASGKPLDRLCRELVLEPLGMHDTAFAVPAAKAGRLASLYKFDPKAASGGPLLLCDAGGAGGAGAPSRGLLRVPMSESAWGLSTRPSAFLAGRQSPVLQGGGCVCSMAGGMVSSLSDYFRLGQMLLQEGSLDGVRVLRAETVQMLASDWLTREAGDRRAKDWCWGRVGVGYCPLGQIGVPHPHAPPRHHPGSKVGTLHWGGAGGSFYILNWDHQLMVLGYTGVVYDQYAQNGMVRAVFGGLRRGGARPLRSGGGPEGEPALTERKDTFVSNARDHPAEAGEDEAPRGLAPPARAAAVRKAPPRASGALGLASSGRRARRRSGSAMTHAQRCRPLAIALHACGLARSLPWRCSTGAAMPCLSDVGVMTGRQEHFSSG